MWKYGTVWTNERKDENYIPLRINARGILNFLVRVFNEHSMGSLGSKVFSGRHLSDCADWFQWVSAFLFDIPPTAKVIWRWGNGLDSHPTGWRNFGSNSGPLGTRQKVYPLHQGGSYRLNLFFFFLFFFLIFAVCTFQVVTLCWTLAHLNMSKWIQD